MPARWLPKSKNAFQGRLKELEIDANFRNHRHGECFVLDDGGEVDLDLGNYERYLNVKLKRDNNITTGKIYLDVINKERLGYYLGRTVQVVPHVTNAVSEWIERVAREPIDDSGEEPDVCIIELGGTVGDVESAPFIEAMRSLRRRAGKNNFLQIHVSHVPIVRGEQKTKPTQQAIRDVRSAGLSPDLIACRCSERLEQAIVDKIAHYCQVELDQVLAVHDVASTYHVPLLLEEQGLVPSLREILKLSDITISPVFASRGLQIWKEWKTLTNAQTRLYDSVSIALVGKYTNLHDSYLSVIKSLEHAAMHCRQKLELIWVDAEHLESHTQRSDPIKYHKAWHQTCTANGILVPGGFGFRGTEGMINATKWARENRKPFLGICLGMQLAVVEFARSVCGFDGASSKEFSKDRETQGLDASRHEVIIPMEEIDQEVMGGTMRLGLQATVFQDRSETYILRQLYRNATQAVQDVAEESGVEKDNPQEIMPTSASRPSITSSNSSLPSKILERHRHRFEINPNYVASLSQKGLEFTGRDEAGKRMEICELPRRPQSSSDKSLDNMDTHPFFVGVQFHPEYLSRVLEPSRPYLGFVAASAGILDDILEQIARGPKEKFVNGIDESLHR